MSYTRKHTYTNVQSLVCADALITYIQNTRLHGIKLAFSSYIKLVTELGTTYKIHYPVSSKESINFISKLVTLGCPWHSSYWVQMLTSI